MSEPEQRGEVEKWVYGGTRVDHKNIKACVWIDGNGKEHWYKHKAGRVPGCVYEVRVIRDAEGEPSSMYSNTRFVGPSEDAELVERLAARHRAAEVEIERLARVRRAKADDPVEKAIAHLADLVKAVPAPQRAGLVAYILHKVSRSAW